LFLAFFIFLNFLSHIRVLPYPYKRTSSSTSSSSASGTGTISIPGHRQQSTARWLSARTTKSFYLESEKSPHQLKSSASAATALTIWQVSQSAPPPLGVNTNIVNVAAQTPSGANSGSSTILNGTAKTPSSSKSGKAVCSSTTSLCLRYHIITVGCLLVQAAMKWKRLRLIFNLVLDWMAIMRRRKTTVHVMIQCMILMMTHCLNLHRIMTLFPAHMSMQVILLTILRRVMTVLQNEKTLPQTSLSSVASRYCLKQSKVLALEIFTSFTHLGTNYHKSRKISV
jgi:hypothetical protein